MFCPFYENQRNILFKKIFALYGPQEFQLSLKNLLRLFHPPGEPPDLEKEKQKFEAVVDYYNSSGLFDS